MFDSLPGEPATEHATTKIIVQSLNGLPTLPDQSLKIIQMFMDEEPDIHDIVRLIETDPAISAKILQVVNAPAYGRLAEIHSIQKAVLMLGFSEVRSLLLSAVVSDSIIKSLGEGSRKTVEHLWKHALVCGVCAEKIAVRTTPDLAAEAFVCGLLHDIGRLVMATCFPGETDRAADLVAERGVLPMEAELDTLGVDHGTVGKWLAERWELPDLFIHAIWLHHHAAETLAQFAFIQCPDLVLTVQLADLLAHEIMADTRLPESARTQRDSLCARFALSAAERDSLLQSVGKAYSEKACLLDLDEAEASFFYRAIQRANRRWIRRNAPGSEPVPQSPTDFSPRFLLDLHLTLSQKETAEALLGQVAAVAQERIGCGRGLAYCKNRMLRTLVGCCWRPDGAKAFFTLSLNKSGHPVWQKPAAMEFDLYQILIRSYKQFVLLADENGAGMRCGAVLDPFHVIPLMKKAFIGAVALDLSSRSQAAHTARSALAPDAYDAFGRVVSHALASVILVGKLRTTADSLSTALVRNRQMAAALEKAHAEKRDMEEKLHNIRKLESMGVLAGGIAHDLNNMLTAVSGSVSLAREYAAANPKASTRLEGAERAIARAQDLVAQLRGFSRGELPVKKPIRIGTPLKEAVRMVLEDSPIGCRLKISGKVWTVEADDGQMNRVFTNLLLNAVQAMPDGGTITVTAENTSLAGESRIPLPAGKYVKISLQDQGCGIDKHHLLNIFDPYFTTKSNGTGLGLTTAYTIVKNHGGYIECGSEPGGGTTFGIYLPAALPPEAGAHPDGGFPSGGGRILVMDDQREIRELAGEMLAVLGYQVGFAEDGAEAVEKYRLQMRSPQPYRAVLMDLAVPGGMGGREAVERLKQLDPSVNAIVTSGFAEDPAMVDFGKYGFSGALAKPYNIGELSRLLGALTAAAPSG